MTKTILITGATDGIGLAAAKQLAGDNHNILLHGRNQAKLDEAERVVRAVGGTGTTETFRADLSEAEDVIALAAEVAAAHDHLDALINNAGVFKVTDVRAANGLDVRFMVNVIAPYMLTIRLLPLLDQRSRVINLSSAAQAPVDPAALTGSVQLDHSNAYAQSKLAITMWSAHLAAHLQPNGPAVIAVNPASFLGTKMVKDAYGSAGNDIGIGADILRRAATSEEFASATGKYFDNDAGRFAPPHPDAQDPAKNAALVNLVERIVADITATQN